MSLKKIPPGKKKWGRPLLGEEPLVKLLSIRFTLKEWEYLRRKAEISTVTTPSKFLRVNVLGPYMKANPLPKGFELNGGTKRGAE